MKNKCYEQAYTAEEARQSVQRYKEKAAVEQFEQALETHLFWTTTDKIKDAAINGLNMVTVYPINPAKYDEYYDNHPSVLGPNLPIHFTQEQLDILHAFEQVGYRVSHSTNNGYKPKNMPSMINGGWTYNVDTMTIMW